MHYQISEQSNYFVQDLKPRYESDLAQQWSRITPGSKIVTHDGQIIVVINPGVQNNYDGPDFLNAILMINNQIKSGNIECHLDASDWYKHGHQNDINYDNVILHVVSKIVMTKRNPEIPTVELSVTSAFNNECLLPPDINRSILLEKLKYFSDQRWKSKIEKFSGTHNNPNKLVSKLIQDSFSILGASANKESFLKLAMGLDNSKIVELSINDLKNYLISLSKELSIKWNRKGIRPAHQPIQRIKLAAELAKYFQEVHLHNYLNYSNIFKRFNLLCPSARGKGIQTEIIGNIILPYYAANALFVKKYSQYMIFKEDWQNLRIPEPYLKYSRKFGHVISKSELRNFWVLQGAIQVERYWCNKELCDICPLKTNYDYS